MNIIKELASFHLKDRKEITKLLKVFCQEYFFKDFPQLLGKVSIIVTGSIATGGYDERSDIDLCVVFQKEADLNKYKPLILTSYRFEKKEAIAESRVEIHGMNMFTLAQIESRFVEWTDWLMREHASSLIIYDPDQVYRKMAKKYVWYPRDIYLEKVASIIEEANFQVTGRYASAFARKNYYYAEVAKIKSIRLLLNALMLAKKKFPVNDKHLFDSAAKSGLNVKAIKMAEQLVQKSDLTRNTPVLKRFLKIVIDELLAKKLISSWPLPISKKPRHKVIFEP